MTDRAAPFVPPIIHSPDRRPHWWQAMTRGLRRRCPHCGTGAAFTGYLKLAPECGSCGAALGNVRADDAPPYFTIVIVGHIVVPTLVVTEQLAHPPMALEMALWPTLTAVLTLTLLPFVKGAVVGVMWAAGINGDEHQ